MVSNAQRSRRRAAARSSREADATQVEQGTTVEETPATEATTETTEPTATTTNGAVKARRTRKPKPEPEPVQEPEKPARNYTAWVAPENKEAAQNMLRPTTKEHLGARGTGLIRELEDARNRVTNNTRDHGPTAGNTVQAIGWHDRTVGKVLIALATANTAGAKREAQDVLAQAQKLTGFGTAKATTRPGKRAYEALQAAEAKKRPARKTAAA